MLVGPELAQKITAACCVLHNLMMTKGREDYVPVGFGDSVADDGRVVNGAWRENIGDSSMFNTNYTPNFQGRSTEHAKEIRDHIKNFVNSEEGSVAWQTQAVL